LNYQLKKTERHDDDDDDGDDDEDTGLQGCNDRRNITGENGKRTSLKIINL
jgi:hypothetical protein